MKKILLSLAALVFCGGSAVAQVGSAASMARLIEEFPSPGGEFRTAPFMVWNTEVSKYQIDNMLNEYRRQGCGAVIIHPRPGLKTDYLSPEWLEMYKYTVDRGKLLGIDVWIYDENSYPSGFAGGHVYRQMPEAYNQGAGLMPTVVGVMPGDVSKYAVVVSEKGGKLTDVTAKAPKMKGKKGKFYLYEKTYYKVSPWYAGGSYVDLLADGVTGKFMEITMDGYEKTFGGDLKNNVKGIFTDEPEVVSSGGLRWTPDLFEAFRARYGYDLRDQLPALHEEVGDWKRVRHDYFALLNDMFVDRWAKSWSRYCDEKGISWTGHYWEHSWPNVTGVIDNMSMAAWQQTPGIDMLFNQFNEKDVHAQFGNIRSVKEVRSIANQLGRQRVLSETYGGAGWEATFKDMKRLADWQMVLGVNLVNQHVGHMSLDGVRKFDYPPMFTRAASWWENYHVLNDYIARICTVMSLGEQVNDILVLEPTTTAWLYNNYMGKPAEGASLEIGQKFQDLVATLEHAQVEFDLGCEHIFQTNGSVRDGKFVVGNRAYSTFVIPDGTENIEGATFDLLKSFVAQGGKLIAFGCPSRVDGVVSPEVEAFCKSNSIAGGGLNTTASKTGLPVCTPEFIESNFRNDDIRFVTVSGGDLHHHRKEFADGQVLLLTNVSLDEPTAVEVALDGKYVVRMDALDGKTYQIPYTSGDGKVAVKTTIEPAGSVLLRVSDEPLAAEKAAVLSGGMPLKEMRPLSIGRVKDNVLLIDFVDLVSGDKKYRNLYYNAAGKQIYLNAGLQDNPWNRAIQYGSDIVNMDLSAAPGFTATYKFTVGEGDVDLASMKILVERPWLYTVKVNGTPVRAGHGWLVDEDFKTMGIGSLVKPGENRIELVADHTTVDTELGAVYVLGNFDVVNRGEKWVIVPAHKYDRLADWQELGAPFYPWEMRYSKFYDVQDTGKRHWVKADRWNGSVAEVWVNDRKVGVIFSDPYTLDITPYLTKGGNHVELRVVGSMQNFIGPHHRAYDGYVGPNCWEVDSSKKASEYRLTPFGLQSDFTLYEGV